ncbi:tyrosine-protein phosphatase [Caryophanon latum]|uniref:Tyrosine-protein phosphatase n=1 Tax=Caryophanon latum TaxID=33977 RepID=A0A1C0YMA4_9BACL|nr:CpsB/CapC family capsule biosynthesis tyrosine phosphatase [Caryophanon latum]OCS88263.1 capsular biosynthesis protein [Caryophanon latum]
MIDMHTHILYGVDDGPKEVADTMAMLEQAQQQKITHIISTSHASHPQYNVTATTVTAQLAELQALAQQFDIKLHRGQEVRIQPNIVDLYNNGELLTLADSRYLLLELPSSNVPQYTKAIIYDLLEVGIIPIIAHPERNKGIAEKPERLEKLIRLGAMSQVTAGSLSGHFGKSVQKTALDLVSLNLVQTYGSDAHNVTTRPSLFNEGLDVLEKKKMADAVDMLLENNEQIIANKPMLLWEPLEAKKKKWWAIFS